MSAGGVSHGSQHNMNERFTSLCLSEIYTLIDNGVIGERIQEIVKEIIEIVD